MRLEHARDYKQKCTDEIRTCEGLQAESVQMRQAESRTCEGLQAESVQMRLEHVRDYKQKV